jgi:hypothetical protein
VILNPLINVRLFMVSVFFGGLLLLPHGLMLMVNEPKLYRLANLSWKHINPDRNLKVYSQGSTNCILLDDMWYSPELKKFPARQDLAVITDMGYVLI